VHIAAAGAGRDVVLTTRRRAAALAGLLAVAAFGAVLGVALSRAVVPVPLVVAACVGLVAVVALTLWRFDLAVGLAMILLPVVRFEPAPVDAVLALVISFAAVTGRFDLRRVPPGLGLLTGCFIAFNVLSTMEAVDLARALQFLSITIYLILFALWLCSYVDGPHRARQIARLYVAGTVFSAVLGSLALFVAFPGSALFISGDGMRGAGLFKDSNVYGPFLVPAALLVVHEALRPQLLRMRRTTALACFAVLCVGVVLSYSRAAWLNLAVGLLVMLALLMLRRGGSRRALGLIAVLLTALAAVIGVLAATGSIAFLEERAHFQSYDSQRFGAQASGLEWAERYPIGIGPGQFEIRSPVSAHSTYVRALAEEGVLGALVLFAIVFGTLGLAIRNAVVGRETFGFSSTVLLAAWCGLLANSAFVDTLHWRHLWLLAGLIWAAAMIRVPAQEPSTAAVGLAAGR
jgi:O-antigen ligase